MFDLTSGTRNGHGVENRVLYKGRNELNQMRLIEKEMCSAIQNNIDWKKDNTEVRYDAESGESKVYLHGNHIATVDDNSMTISDGGYQTKTTKARLNALCSEFCVDGEGVYQKNYQWFVRFTNDSGKTFQTEVFSGEYCFA